ncbi:LPXTG cell wall anchor domain-containing protein [Streptomyces sp. TRM49041]|uniref:LPXTG cell wall anchor domain-containing protein n=1 Tax=Streptomyces sp. TRM49041 TaxID=2603216 RepID=UPI0011EBA1E7|nr:LPXTG cell wall anchor domain-containing protein [Streptomyces sp. TRM49041]
MPEDLILSATTVTQGDSLTFTGPGFGAGEDGIESAIFSSKITLDFHTADENGMVTDTVTIPHHVEPGEHIFRLKGEAQVHLAEITVLDDDDDGGDPGHDHGGRPGHDHGGKPGHDHGGRPGHDHDGKPHLADTGGDRSAVLLGGAAGLLLLGGGAILLTRRVRRG